jgi:hypothetical protein
MTDLQPSSAAVTALRIRFLADAPAAGRILAEFADPERRYALAETISPDALPPAGQDTVPLDELYVLSIPAGAATPFDAQQRAAAWMAKPAAPTAEPTLEIVMRSDRLLWRPGRALVQGAPERLDENLAALVEFAFYEGQLRRLETEIAADWPTAEADVPLTHQVDAQGLKRLAHVADMTRRTTLRRMRFARLEPHLEKPSAALPGSARRLAAELATQAEVVDRLKALDDRLEVHEDLYELANDRLSEFRYFRAEFWLEVGIIVILIVEIIEIAYEMWYVSP